MHGQLVHDQPLGDLEHIGELVGCADGGILPNC